MIFSLHELLKKRKASRAFSDKKITDEMINSLMTATQLSASCRNFQSWRFIFLTEHDALEKGRKALSEGNSWAKKAPVLVFGFSKPDIDCQSKDGRNYYTFDLGLATQLLMLQATELNLIARPMAGFSQSILKSEFSIPDEYEIYIMIAIGYEENIEELDERLKKKSTAPRNRNPLENNFFMNQFIGG